MLIDKSKVILEKILGNPQKFSIEHRCLIGACIFSSIAFFIGGLMSYLINLPMGIFLGNVLFGALFSFYYYFSRFKRIFKSIFWFVLVSACLFVSLTWFFTGGVSGPAIILSLIILAGINLITTKFERIIAICILVFTLIALFLIEYIYPHLITGYHSREAKLVDNCFTFIVAVLVISFIINYAMEHFRSEKSKAEQAKKTIQNREKQFRVLIESAPDAVFVHHHDEFFYLNYSAVKLFGAAKSDDLTGSSIIDRIHPSYHSIAHDRFQRLNNKESTPRLRMLYLRMDGSPVEVEVSSVPIKYFERNAALVFARDISDRREIEGKLEFQNQQMKTILEGIPFGYLYMEASSGRIVQSNITAKKIIKNMPVKNIHEFMRCAAYHMDGRQFEPSDYPVAHVLSTGEPIIRKKIYYPGTKETEIFIVNSAYPIHNDKRKIIGVVSLFEDITSGFNSKKEQEELKEQLYHSQKKEAIGTLAGGVAHDFNNILSGMLGYAQLTKMHIGNIDKANRNTDQMIKSIYRAADLVQQILTFSRQTEHEKRPLKISLVVKEVLRLLRASLPSTIKIEKEISDSSSVIADSTKVHQIVMNLCTNAYHAMHENGGILTVRLNQTKFSKPTIVRGRKILPGIYAKLEIEDTGHGMNSDIIDRIFEPYFTTKKIGKGTGLGLSIVNGIVEDHNGYIDVSSKPNQGTCVDIFFPVVEKNIDSGPLITKEEPILIGEECIMLVDDDETILESGRELLEECGYKVSCFPDGAQAFLAFENDPQKFDLVITDMTMPHMTGYELSSKILNIRPELYIFLCTGYSENFSEDEAIKLGIFKFVEKPVDIKSLICLFRSMMDKK